MEARQDKPAKPTLQTSVIGLTAACYCVRALPPPYGMSFGRSIISKPFLHDKYVLAKLVCSRKSAKFALFKAILPFPAIHQQRRPIDLLNQRRDPRHSLTHHRCLRTGITSARSNSYCTCALSQVPSPRSIVFVQPSSTTPVGPTNISKQSQQRTQALSGTSRST